MERMKELVELLNKHCYNYYVLDNPSISDADFDVLYDELVSLEKKYNITLENSPTKRVGGDILSGFTKRTHKIKMYSLNKSKTFEEIKAFVNDVKKEEPNSTFTLGYKYDGLTLVLEYDKGYLVSATTRGNGSVGEDVTNQVKTIKSVPLKINFDKNLIVTGEGMITNKNLEKYNKTSTEPLKNARNAVSGAIRNLDPKETAKRNLDFFCYGVLYAEDKKFDTQAQMNEFIKENGFLYEPYFKVLSTAEEIYEEIQKIDKIKTDVGFLIDGMVIKLNEVAPREKFGYTAKFPKWALAYKFEAQEVTSILKDVVWQVGRTGKITPIAEIEPVELAGATIRRATLNNYGDILRKNLKLNARVFVRRSNEVIPEILGLAEELENSKEIIKPVNCPCCNSKLVEKGAHLFCENRLNCKDQVVDRLTHFASRNAMNIEGLSEQTCEAIYNSFNVGEPSGLYSLKEENLLKLDKFKEKKSKNIIQSLEKSKNVELSNFIYAIGISNVGTKTAKDLAKKFKSLQAIKNASFEELIKVKDVGDIVANSIIEFFADEFNNNMISNLLNVGININNEKENVSEIFSGQTFVLTGTLSKFTREEASKLIEENGGQTSSSVSKNTSYVLAGENAGGKLAKAKSLNIKVISEDEFLEMLKKV